MDVLENLRTRTNTTVSETDSLIQDVDGHVSRIVDRTNGAAENGVLQPRTAAAVLKAAAEVAIAQEATIESQAGLRQGEVA